MIDKANPPAGAPTQLAHLNGLDLGRGLAALAVVCYHLITGNPVVFDNWPRFFELGLWGYYGVQVFFVISGLVIPYAMHRAGYRWQAFGTFMWKRLVRIEPPYLASIVLVLVLNWASTLSSQYAGQPFRIDWLQVSMHLGYLNVIFHEPWLSPVYWTLGIEFQFYLIMAAAFSLISHRKPGVWVPTLLAFMATFYLPTIYQGLTVGSLHGIVIPYRDYILAHAGYFVFGMLLYKWTAAHISLKQLGWYSLGLSLLAIPAHGPKFMVICGLVTALILFVRKVPKWGVWLGNISFSLYLIHHVIGMKIMNLGIRFMHSPWQRLGLFFVAVVVCLVASYLFYLVIEKPFKNIAGRIKYRKPQPVPVVATQPGH